MNQYLLLNNFVVDAIRDIFIYLDKIIYHFAKSTYSVFCFLSEFTLVNDNSIRSFNNRIYAILGIFMIFVFAYNLLVYIINPDKMTDNKVGAGALIKDVIIALLIITISPAIFTKLYSFQNIIITRGVISNLIVGGFTTSSGDQVDPNSADAGRLYIEQGAKYMVADVFSAFIEPYAGFSTADCGKEEYSNDPYCLAYESARESGDISEFVKVVNQDEKYDYHWLLSTAAGVVLLFFMLAFCLDLGKRVGKMAILQLIAPVPLIMEILPNKKGTRKRWAEELMKTYLEVFIFQATIFIVMFLITLIPDILGELFSKFFDSSNGSFTVRTLSLVFLIFGLLQFGKEIPKLIPELLGIKTTGTITAAFKRGIAMAGVTGGLMGSTVGRIARNFTSDPDADVKDRILSGLGGAGSGLVRNLWGARNVHNLKDAKALRQSVNKDVITARVRRDTYAQQHQSENIAFAHAKDLFKGIKENAYDFTHDGYSASNTQLKSFDEYKSIFDTTKIKTNDDTRYMNYQKQFDDILMRNHINPSQFKVEADKWTKNNPGKKIGDYITSDSGLSYDFANGNSIKADVKALDEALNARKETMIVDKKNDLIKALANAKALANNNADIAKIINDTGVDINSLALDADSDNNTILSVYEELEKINKAVNKETTRITAENAQKEYEKKIREARRGNSSDKK